MRDLNNSHKMKMRILISLIILLLPICLSFSQDKTRTEFRRERQLEIQKKTEAIINSKEFIFVPRTVLAPVMRRPVNISLSEYHIKFQPDLIDSYMPFYGSADFVVGYSSDSGLIFSGKPDKFTIEKKKNFFLVNVVVKGVTDEFTISLSIVPDRGASLSISSNNRSTISYQGVIN
jgi:hypothetical protein